MILELQELLAGWCEAGSVADIDGADRDETGADFL
jgi:hypothetical protein